jgi:alkylation response protein AidB-like acyl-CoA dehydrogenase
MLAQKTLKLSVKSLKEFAKKRLPDEVLIELDERDECPIDVVRDMCSPDKLGIQLLFIPEEFGGMGGGTFDVYCICEEMARIDLGIATSVLATFLGSDPITVGATPEQKKTGSCKTDASLATRSMATSNGSVMVESPEHTPSWPARPPGRHGSL